MKSCKEDILIPLNHKIMRQTQLYIPNNEIFSKKHSKRTVINRKTWRSNQSTSLDITFTLSTEEQYFFKEAEKSTEDHVSSTSSHYSKLDLLINFW
jgi:hypothetical protein